MRLCRLLVVRLFRFLLSGLCCLVCLFGAEIREREHIEENDWLMMNTVLCLQKVEFSNLNDEVNQLLPSY